MVDRQESQKSATSSHTLPVSEQLNTIHERPDSPSAMTDYSFDNEDDVRLPTRVEHIRDPGRGAPADSLGRKGSKSKRSHAFYNDAFALREAAPTVPAGTPVWVEMKTNIIIENEFEFTKSFSQVLAKRYQKPESEIALSVDHASCMIMGGTYSSCYFLTITSLTSVSPTCNKRNVALIAGWLNSQLGVPPNRGYIRFVEPEISNLAFGGFTCLDLLEKEKAAVRPGTSQSRPGTATTLTNSVRESRAKRSILGRHKSSSVDESRPPIVKNDNINLVEGNPNDGKTAIRRGRSMFSLFGKAKVAAA